MAVLGFIILLERKRAAVRNNTQVVLQLFLRHPDPGIGNRQCPASFIGSYFNVVILFIKHQSLVGQCFVIDFVDGIACIRDQLPQENLPLCIDGVNHHFQQSFGFGFKLFFGHE
ncbi:hypothetical protein D3C75_1200140 [compost metagenome]